MATCDVTYFTHGGRSEERCGSDDDTRTCARCGFTVCTEHSSHRGMTEQTDGSYICEDCD